MPALTQLCIVIDEEAQTTRVKLKPVFEHLRQLKLQGFTTKEY